MSRAARRTATTRTTPTTCQATRPWMRRRDSRRPPAPGSSSAALGGCGTAALVVTPDPEAPVHRRAAPQRGARANQQVHRLDRRIAHVCYRLVARAHPQPGSELTTFARRFDGAHQPLRELGRTSLVRSRREDSEFGWAEPANSIGHPAGGLQYLHA